MSSIETDYISAMNRNFYNNTLRFGGFKTARALNTDDTVKYELVYLELIDNVTKSLIKDQRGLLLNIYEI